MKVQVELDELLEYKAALEKQVKKLKFDKTGLNLTISTIQRDFRVLEGNYERACKESYDYSVKAEKLEDELRALHENILKCESFGVTITDIKGNESKFPDHTMD